LNGLLEGIARSIAALSPWEAVAVVLAIAYLLLAMRESIWCWYCAFVSTAIYTVLLWNVSLLMESLLNVYYMGMAVYGWWQWRRGGEQHEGVTIRRWGLKHHLFTIGGIVLVSLISGYFLKNGTSAEWPYVDSFTTWASVITTWMVAKKILENWLYWIVIDTTCVFMYFDRGLHLSSLLFAAYVVIVIFGYFKWRAHERQGDLAVA